MLNYYVLPAAFSSSDVFAVLQLITQHLKRVQESREQLAQASMPATSAPVSQPVAQPIGSHPSQPPSTAVVRPPEPAPVAINVIPNPSGPPSLASTASSQGSISQPSALAPPSSSGIESRITGSSPAVYQQYASPAVPQSGPPSVQAAVAAAPQEVLKTSCHLIRRRSIRLVLVMCLTCCCVSR